MKTLLLLLLPWIVFALDSSNLENEQYNLNKNQLEYLQNKQVIKMCVDPHWLPFEAIIENQHTGMVADVFKIIQEKLPILIQLIPTNTWNQSLTNIKNKQCDILAAAAQTKEREEYLNFTTSYLRFPQVIVTKETTGFIEEFQDVIQNKIAVVKKSAIQDLLLAKYPKINIVEVNNIEDGLLQVSQGKVFGFVNTSAAVSYYIQKEGLTNLQIASKVGIDYFIRTAIRKDDLHLLDIFNTILGSLEQNQINQIKDKWLTVKLQTNVDYTILYKMAAIFSIVLLLILYWNRKLKIEVNRRIQIENELNKFSQVIDQSNVSVIITDTEGIIEYVNPYCIKQTGYTNNELLGCKPNILKSDFHEQSFYENLWETISSGKTWHGEFKNKRKNGEIFNESAVIAPIFDKDHQIIMYASIKENIDQQIQTRQSLIAAQQQALLANSAKSEFLAKMSHEIRTPMNAIIGMLYLLQKTNPTTIQNNYIEKAGQAANNLLGLINDILDFSKIEAGKMNIINNEFDFNKLLIDTLHIMSFKAEEKGLELLADFDQNIPKIIITDQLRLAQILNNLLSNAIKFTTMGEIIVSTKLLEQNKDAITIQLCIKDSGIGISKEDQQNLFQEFTQVDSSATRSLEGTGLGLAICKKLSSLLGGDIWIEQSVQGLGTTFCFTIVAKQSTNQTKTMKLNVEKLKNLQVLVVDDNKSSTHILNTMLHSIGIITTIVHSGKEAVSYLRKNSYDLILLDYKMSDLDGIETYKMALEDIRQKKIKTIIVSAFSKELIDQNLQALGIEEFMSKPIFPDQLYEKIYNVIYNPNQLSNSSIDFATQLDYFENKKVLLAEDNKLNQEFAQFILKGIL